MPFVPETSTPPLLMGFTDKGDRFGDRHGAETARIEAVDLAGGRRLGDCPSEGLARCCAAAWVDVIAHAGDPCPRCLRIGRHQ